MDMGREEIYKVPSKKVVNNRNCVFFKWLQFKHIGELINLFREQVISTSVRSWPPQSPYADSLALSICHVPPHTYHSLGSRRAANFLMRGVPHVWGVWDVGSESALSTMLSLHLTCSSVKFKLIYSECPEAMCTSRVSNESGNHSRAERVGTEGVEMNHRVGVSVIRPYKDENT